MRKYKLVVDGYILFFGTGCMGTEITDAEYEQIISCVRNKPEATEGYGYRLRDSDLTWELYELPVLEEPQLTETEEKALSYDILTGVAE